MILNYQAIYDSLICRASLRKSDNAVYYEKHHIIPRCMGGSNSRSNLVLLTPEEHYLAHQLLVKIYPKNHSLIKAATIMTAGNGRNNKLYGWLRRRLSESMTGSNNSFYGKTHTPAAIAEMKRTRAGRVTSEETKKLQAKSACRDPRPAEVCAKVSATKKLSQLTPRTKISTPHGEFNSIIECSRFLGRHSATIISKLDNERYTDWYRVN